MAGVARQDGLSFHVEVSGPEQDGWHYEVGPDGLLVGRSSACDLVFESREVSRRHAYFYVAEGACCIKDLSSKNGTLVNGQRVRETRLRDGDIADVGPNRLVVRRQGAAAHAPPAAEPQEGTGTPAEPGQQLALAALVTAALAYLYWAFGVGGTVLAAISLYEMRGALQRVGRALAIGGLVLGLCGSLASGWFVEIAPHLRAQSEEQARLKCQQKLVRVSAALSDYRAAHAGAFPAKLADLADEGLLKPVDLECPGRALNGPGPATYLFLTPRRGYLARPTDVILADANLSYHQGKGGWIVRVDGQVEWLPDGLFADVLAQAYGTRREPAAATAGREAPEP
jgi:hypothetical protein